MDFTEEEKEVFSVYDPSLSDPVSYLDDGVLSAYDYSDENAHKVDVTFSYIKRMLLEVAKIRGYNVDPDAKYDLDELLENGLDEPRHLQGFDKKLYRNPEQLRAFIANAISGKSYEEIEDVMDDVHLHNTDLNGLMAKHIPNLLNRVIELNSIIESSKEEYVDTFGQSTESVSIEPAEEFPDDYWDDVFFDPNDVEDPFASVRTDQHEERKELDEEELKSLLMFVNSVLEIAKCKKTCSEIMSKLRLIKNEKKLEVYHSDEEFMSRLNAIMDHDPNERTFYYHGTQCLEDAESIITQGLGMHQEFLSSTTYTEFTPDELILYSRGHTGEVGSEAIVILEGKRGEDIVEELEDKSSVNFSPSGLQGLNIEAEYIVRPKHILGYVDKRNKKVVLNPQYEKYDELKEKMDSQKAYS